MNNFRLIRTNILLYAKQRNLANSNHGISPQSFVKLVVRSGGSVNTMHTSSVSFQTKETDHELIPLEKKYKHPVDWLPFEWHRRPEFSVLRESGEMYILIKPANIGQHDFDATHCRLQIKNNRAKCIFLLIYILYKKFFYS